MPDLPIPYPEFVRRLAKSGTAIHTGLVSADCELLHAALGVAGEAAELLEALRPFSVNPALGWDDANLKEELGDLEFYTEHLRQILGVSRYVPGAELPWYDDLPATAPYATKVIDAAHHLVVASGGIIDGVKRVVIYRPANASFDDAVESFAPTIAVGLTNLEAALRDLRGLLNLTREEILAHNESKLMKRYQGLTFSDAEAHERKDKA
jgi:hypothetical protein